MTGQVLFDRLGFVNRLKVTQSFSETQASDMADALDTALREGVATKMDIKDLQLQIKDMQIKLYLALLGHLMAMFGLISYLSGQIPG